MKKLLKIDLTRGSAVLFVIIIKYLNHGKNGVKQRHKCQNAECKKLSMIFLNPQFQVIKRGLDKWLPYAQCVVNGNTIRQCAEIVNNN